MYSTSCSKLKPDKQHTALHTTKQPNPALVSSMDDWFWYSMDCRCFWVYHLCLLTPCIALNKDCFSNSTAIHLLTPQSNMNYPPPSIYVWGFKKISWIIGMRSESVLWVRGSQLYWTRYSYCNHCLAICTWFCLVSLALWDSLYNKNCLHKRSFKFWVVL